MERKIFRQHLDRATTALVDFTKTLCYNQIASNFKYQLTPNARIVDQDDEHLTEYESAVLGRWNEHENERLNAEQIVDLLYHDGKVPVWVDVTIYEAKKQITIIDLYCSRRLRTDDELYYQGEIAPFHLQVNIPPDRFQIETHSKFDVNWKKRRDQKLKRARLLKRFKGLFKTNG